MAQDYNKTLNLPETEFPMRAGLPNREPGMLAHNEEIGLYKRIIEKNKDLPKYVLHDGPPFSNNNIHMGTAMNKVLKDFVNKYKMMSGFNAIYVPGWDNHGMPIESAIIKKNKLDRTKMSIPEFRDACKKFAEGWVDAQMTQFKRLGVIGDWENPYLTMKPEFEATEVKVFGEMYKKGYIYKGLKPVYWCPQDQTALAEAEIEYIDAPCKSIYVSFKIKNDQGKLAQYCDLDKLYFVIWTTTTWTLPGNLAIALNPQELYVLAKVDNGNVYIMAKELVAATMKQAKIENYEIIAELKGNEFDLMTAQHPFLDRDSLIVNADYVTMDSGTGCVHTAPGHGADDYLTGRRYNLPMLVPVNDKGVLTEDAGQFAGMYYEKSNAAIFDHLVETGALFAYEDIVHPYPHCWRCKNPIIFRATPQWFCSVESFKDDAVAACENVTWSPAWGGDRMVSMIRERADWCISRQRHWGLPIPVFYCEDCTKPVCTDETIAAVSEMFKNEGSNSWYIHDVAEILPEGFKCPHCGGVHFFKETDTLDGWFDSGSTHFVVVDGKEDHHWPADLYLEGADQYRGWFQSSLLTAVATKNQGAPYKNVLTHGWVVDGEGKKMSKSLGNTVDPLDVMKEYGADILRLWVASSDYRVDVRVSKEIFKQLSQMYLKIRNTARYILGNIADFDANNLVKPEEMMEIDRWAVTKLTALMNKVKEGYEAFEYHVVHHSIHNFCVVELSNFYLDVIKDRLYCEKKDGIERRSAQTAIYLILDSMVKMLAPILAFTSDEIWQAMPHKDSDDTMHVMLNQMNKPFEAYHLSDDEMAKWEELVALRTAANQGLEEARASKLIGKPLEAKITLYMNEDLFKKYEGQNKLLETLFIVSQVEMVCGNGGKQYSMENVGVEVTKAEGEKCERCWMFSHTVGTNANHPTLCERCAKVLE